MSGECSETPGKYRSRVEIISATLRDVSYILANLCEDDERELRVQHFPGFDLQALSPLALAGEAWVATVDGQPVEAFGLVRGDLAPHLGTAWAFGTGHRRRAMPAVTRFIRRRVVDWLLAGVTRVEARSISDHIDAHRWLIGLGAQALPLPMWGRNGEDFALFWWTRETWAG